MIVDANVIVSASLGRSMPLVDALLAQGETLMVPEAQMREATLVTATLATRRHADPGAALGWTSALLTIPADLYHAYEGEARDRLHRGGQKDWPLVALALASGEDIWSNDVDLFGTGIAVWNTHNISRAKPRSAATGANGI